MMTKEQFQAAVSELAIKDGKVAECDVEQRLQTPDGW